MYIPSFGSITRSCVKLAVYGLTIYLAHSYRGSPPSSAISSSPKYAESPPSLNFSAKKKYRHKIKPPAPSPPLPPPAEWPPPSPDDLLQEVTAQPAFCLVPGFDLDSDLEQSDPDPILPCCLRSQINT
jgi:hypothetical protein